MTLYFQNIRHHLAALIAQIGLFLQNLFALLYTRFSYRFAIGAPFKKVLAAAVAQHIIRENLELRIRARSAERQAMRDEPTGLANRRAFDLAQGKASANPHLSFVLFDLNNFGMVNKIAGHKKGDELIKEFAKVLKKEAKYFSERTFRYGADEFVAIVPNGFAEEFRNNVETSFSEYGVGNFIISVSGAIGKDFEEADGGLQSRKRERKAGK